MSKIISFQYCDSNGKIEGVKHLNTASIIQISQQEHGKQLTYIDTINRMSIYTPLTIEQLKSLVNE